MERSCPCLLYTSSAFIDGALEDGDREELMAHMAECPDCQAYFDDQIAIHDVLQGMEAQAPADFTAKVMEQVRQEPRQDVYKRQGMLAGIMGAAEIWSEGQNTPAGT